MYPSSYKSMYSFSHSLSFFFPLLFQVSLLSICFLLASFPFSIYFTFSLILQSFKGLGWLPLPLFNIFSLSRSYSLFPALSLTLSHFSCPFHPRFVPLSSSFPCWLPPNNVLTNTPARIILKVSLGAGKFLFSKRKTLGIKHSTTVECKRLDRLLP